MQTSITLLPCVGDPMLLPFSVEAESTETFREVVIRGIASLAKRDETLWGQIFDLSTASANIYLVSEDYELAVDVVIKKYGTGSFTLMSGKAIRGPEKK
jgi:hypothetical protein